MTTTHTETLMPTQLRNARYVVGTVHDEDTVCAAIATFGTEYVEATARAAPKSVGKALALIAGAAVVVGLGAAAAAAFLVVSQPTQPNRPSSALAPHVISIPGVISISIPWRRHAQ